MNLSSFFFCSFVETRDHTSQIGSSPRRLFYNVSKQRKTAPVMSGTVRNSLSPTAIACRRSRIAGASRAVFTKHAPTRRYHFVLITQYFCPPNNKSSGLGFLHTPFRNC